ncbi:MAG TPA: biosynthetic-type acetolactate synthase large subunit [Candidatus Alistipes merdigallinarum]|nr:biosynthetic-type acetolactate synthase large subunit [Candidatus Alistipes merdigallinarum]
MANKPKIKGAEALLLSLIAEGTDTIFGYPGGQVIPIYDHLYHFTDRINHILTRHEQGAVHAAQGYARATGKVGVCLVTSGPGATNLVTGIADAMLDSTPLVCITGQVPCSLLGTDAFQEADTISMTMPISKWNYQVTQASEIPSAIARAFYIARSGRPGPVVIDISKNAQVEEFDFSYKPCIYLRSYKPHPELDLAQVDQAVQMINAAEKPLLLVGQGVKLANAESKLLEFAEAAGVPMASTLMGISAVPSNHPLFVGNLGMHGNLAANEMTQNSDLIIAVGMRFSDRVTGDVKNYAPHAKIIHIDVDAAELNKNIKADLPIHADAADALEAMKRGISYKDRSRWLALAAENNKKEFAEVVLPSTDPQGEYISMYDVVSTLAEVEKGDAVIVTDVGQNQMFSARYSKFNQTRSFITSGGLGTMGFGLPAAMGAKLGVPDREVVAIMGDGGFQMTMQELGTIMQNHIGLKMIVLNNTYLGMVRQWQQLFFGKRYSFTQLENPDFPAIAAAYGIANRRVERLADLKAAIQELAEAPGAYFLEVDVLPEENVFPMVPAGASLSDTICKE